VLLLERRLAADHLLLKRRHLAEDHLLQGQVLLLGQALAEICDKW
jgi:hypothetical protein